jgi:asparagine synthetase B (glutamine-hydrolysing)
MIHRGPDDAGGPMTVGWGWRIGDLPSLIFHLQGISPCTMSPGAFSIVFNGEIYNFAELLEQLIAKGMLSARTRIRK